MSPTPEDLENLNDPHVGNLGESPEAFELRRLHQSRAERAAAALNEAQADIPMRENFGDHAEGESWDTPEMTHSAIADRAAGRAGARIRAAAGLTPRAIVPPAPQTPGLSIAERAEREETPPLRAHDLVRQERPRRSQRRELALPEGFSEEMNLIMHQVVSELGRGLAQKFEDLRQDLEENTRLLGVMNAPMEAITDSHERAAESFETLRNDIARGIDTSPAIAQLSKLVDNAGLAEAQSRAERRFEKLAAAIAASLLETRKEVKDALDGVSLNMVQVLHLLERLLQREAREIKRRAASPT